MIETFEILSPNFFTGNAMKKILVIDDEENIRLLYKEELEDAGYEVTVASSAEEALEKFRKQPPDAITLDIKMPDMDGIELLRIMKDECRDIPIVLCSAYGRYKQDFRIWASDAYVVKSADLEELKLTLKDVIKT